jgi:hypothetical protein
MLLVLIELSKINLIGLLLVSIVPTLIVIEGFYGMNWLVFLVGGTCCGTRHSFS